MNGAPQPSLARSMSLNSDEDEYHYSDLEDEDEEERAAAHEDIADDDDDDDDEYQYSEEDESDVASDSTAGNSLAPPSQQYSNKSQHAHSSRLSPLGVSGGSAAKKKRVSNSHAGLDAASASSRRQGEDYRVIDEEELFVEQRTLIREIAQVLEVPVSQAAVLLRHFAWNKEKLFEGYYADPGKARADAGLEFADTPSPSFAPSTEVSCVTLMRMRMENDN